MVGTKHQIDAIVVKIPSNGISFENLLQSLNLSDKIYNPYCVDLTNDDLIGVNHDVKIDHIDEQNINDLIVYSNNILKLGPSDAYYDEDTLNTYLIASYKSNYYVLAWSMGILPIVFDDRLYDDEFRAGNLKVEEIRKAFLLYPIQTRND